MVFFQFLVLKAAILQTAVSACFERTHIGRSPMETVWDFMVDADFYFGKALETKGDRSYIKAFEGSGGRVSGNSQ